MTTLDVRGVSVSFGGVLALCRVDLEARSNRVHAVIGPNGAGKSTLLNAINGFVPVTSGVVNIGGTEVVGCTPAAIARLDVARTFQDPRLIDSLSVVENIAYGLYHVSPYSWLDQLARPLRVRRIEQDALARSRELVAVAQLGAFADLPVSALAYGTRKLVEILRALVSDPKVLLLDEPTSGLGADERVRFAATITRHLAAKPTTVILVEHHIDVVRALADEVTGLAAGEAFASGDVDHVLAEQTRTLEASLS